MTLVPSILRGFGSSPRPAALSITGTRIAAATLDWRGGQPVVSAHVVEPLPAGAVVPALAAPNIRDRAAVAGPLNRVLERLGRPRRVALIVADPVARVSLVRFEQVPARADDLEQLVRWQVRKAAPFPIEEAQVGYAAGASGPAGAEFVATVARREVVLEYEGLCADAGAHAGIVDVETLNLANAAIAGGAPAGDWLLVNVAPDYASIAILNGPHPIFFRHRGADAAGSLADLVHQSAMYYEDRLQGTGFTRALIAGTGSLDASHGPDVNETTRLVETRLGVPLQPLDARAVVSLTDRISVAPALLDALAPLAGVLLRNQAEAA